MSLVIRLILIGIFGLAGAGFIGTSGKQFLDNFPKAVSQAIPNVDPSKPEYWNREKLGSLPLSQHAQTDHLDREWGASLIQQWMARKDCRPLLLYICTGAEQIVLTCPNPVESTAAKIGLIVGWANSLHSPQVVTGYPARDDYWEGVFKKQNCFGPVPLP